MSISIPTWFMYILLSLLTWGVWGFVHKLATNYIQPKSIIIYETIGIAIIGLVLFFLMGSKIEIHPRGAMLGFLGGILGILGTFFLLVSLSKGGKTSIVVVLSALYPLITITLAFLFLKEPLSLKQGIGICMALIAMILFST